MTRLSQLFPLLLLALLLGLTFWLNQALQQGSRVSAPELHDPDFIIEKIVAHRMNASGDVKHTLHAERMTHYPDNDSTDLISPRFISSASTAAPVTITSRTAKVSSGGEHIDFETDVRVVRAAYAQRSELVLETSFLRVIPDENTARTDRPVTITDAHTVAHAIGLELNSETRIAKFLSHFTATYHDPGRATQRR